MKNIPLAAEKLTPGKELYINYVSPALREAQQTGWFRVIIGDSVDIDGQRKKAADYKGPYKVHFCARFSIPGLRDHAIHNELKRPFRCREVKHLREDDGDDVNSVEVYAFKVDPNWSDDEMILHAVSYVNSVVEGLGGASTLNEFILTTWQRKAIEFIGQCWSEGKQTLVMELAARFGKTGTHLTLLDYSDAQVMVVANYFKSVNTSFAQTINSCFRDRIRWVNIGDATFESDLREALDGGYKVVIGAALHDKARLTDRINLIRSIEKRFVVVDEADFGAHTKSQFAKVQSLREGCPLILTTGTNADRAVAGHKVDASMSITYFDMLTMAQG